MNNYMIPSYWKSVNLGDPKLYEFFKHNHFIVEEKIDGSQFSWAIVEDTPHFRSRNKAIDLENPETMFKKAVEHVMELHSVGQVPKNKIFRAEAVTSLKHNTLKYERCPTGCVVVFGIEDAISGEALSRSEMEQICQGMGLEVAPLLLEWKSEDATALIAQLDKLLENKSCLGGALLEGVVIKRVGNPMMYFDRPLFAKLVSASFREQHKIAWKETNPGKEEIIQRLVMELSGPARYAKAVQHLRDEGVLTGELKDIGPLIQEVKRDVVEEGEAHAKEMLWKWAKDQIARAAGSGVPEWYKAKLRKELEDKIAGDKVNE